MTGVFRNWLGDAAQALQTAVIARRRRRNLAGRRAVIRVGSWAGTRTAIRTAIRTATHTATDAAAHTATHAAARARSALRWPCAADLWLALAGVLAACMGAVVIAGHARQLARTVQPGAQAGGAAPVSVLRLPGFVALLAGQRLDVPAAAGLHLLERSGATVLVAAGLRAGAPMRIDLCAQLAEPAAATRQASGRLVPIRLGYSFAEVARWAPAGRAPALRVVGLRADGADVPHVQIGGNALAGTPLQLHWDGAPAGTRWVGDRGGAAGASGSALLGADGWLLWRADAAIRIQRVAARAGAAGQGPACRAGVLLVQLMRAGAAGEPAVAGPAARVMLGVYPSSAPATAAGIATASSPHPVPVSARAHVPASAGDTSAAWLAPGAYRVASTDAGSGTADAPAHADPPLEDQTLFEQLRQRAMVRLNDDGLAELAPADLAAWRAAPAAARAGTLASWDQVALDADGARLLKRAWRMADGAYVRDQLRIFNRERRLLAWRSPEGDAAIWQASRSDGAAAAVSGAMPAAAARLFAALPQGWQAWRRIDGLQGGAAATSARLTLALPAPAAATGAAAPAAAPAAAFAPLPPAPPARMRLMLVGRAGAIGGAVLRQRLPVCDGRACPAPDAAAVLVLEPLPGARAITVDVDALDMAGVTLPADARYRHVRVADGRLEWQPLVDGGSTPGGMAGAAAAGKAAARVPAAAVPAPAVLLSDRHGVPLWRDGVVTPAAKAAGLAPLLGIHREHQASVAGMLARLGPGGAASPVAGAPAPAHDARLTIDLSLQAASQRALDCVGMRHGAWDGARCTGGQAAPPGRHAGLVIVDTQTGDILAAAGAGTVDASAANWAELRNFDRNDPARSPLRLPAFQHDGGAYASPGSTFKVISALGLELAARDRLDPALDALLAGMPLADIDRLARQRGFGFATDAAVYPLSARAPGLAAGAHVTNYRSQGMAQRAVAGQVGLAQALAFSVNTWFAWTGELADRSLFGRADGGLPGVQALDGDALDGVRPIVAMARKLGFGRALRLDGGLLPPDYLWGAWDALQASAANIDPIHTRHELRQMAIGLRMQVTPLQMALAAGAVGQGGVIAPRLLLALDGRAAAGVAPAALGVRLDRVRAGMKGVIEVGTGAAAFRAARYDRLRRGLSGKTGTAPTGDGGAATVWFTGWIEPGTLPGQTHRLALASFVSHSAGSGGEHAAPIVAAALADFSFIAAPGSSAGTLAQAR